MVSAPVESSATLVPAAPPLLPPILPPMLPLPSLLDAVPSPPSLALAALVLSEEEVHEATSRSVNSENLDRTLAHATHGVKLCKFVCHRLRVRDPDPRAGATGHYRGLWGPTRRPRSGPSKAPATPTAPATKASCAAVTCASTCWATRWALCGPAPPGPARDADASPRWCRQATRRRAPLHRGQPDDGTVDASPRRAAGSEIL